MRWQGRQGSSNVDDRRRGGGGRGRRAGQVGGGLGVVGVIAVVVIMLMGGDPSDLINMQAQQQRQTQQQAPTRNSGSQPDDQLAQFSSVVLKDTEDVWNKIFREEFRKDYPEPKLVIYRNMTQSGCGTAQSATGPFYCPADQDVYLDLSFFSDLQNRFGAAGDFAAAYVIAHEVGHHVQRLLGATEQVHRQKGRISEARYNQLSVRLELQADFYAGVWAHYADKWKGVLEQGDIEESLRAANAIGDDRLQKQAQGYAVPESFTHGTSEQRMRWFMKGYQTGDIRQGDTFSARSL